MGGPEFIDEAKEVEPTKLELFAEELAKLEGIDFDSLVNAKHKTSFLCCFSRYGSNAKVSVEYHFLCTYKDSLMKPFDIKNEKKVRDEFSEEIILSEFTGQGQKKILFRYSPRIKDNHLYEVRIDSQLVGSYTIEELIKHYHDFKKLTSRPIRP